MIELKRSDFETNEEYVYGLLETYCSHRMDVEKFMAWLLKTDYFTAPASTKFHLDSAGGLFIHSCHVMENLIFLSDSYLGQDVYDNSSLIICGLFHDICKTNYYRIDKKWRKDGQGRWEQYDTYIVDDELPLGHGEKSVILLQDAGIKLTKDEMMAIRWHMSGYDKAAKGGELAINEAYNKSKLMTLLQCADLLAANVIEN